MEHMCLVFFLLLFASLLLLSEYKIMNQLVFSVLCITLDSVFAAFMIYLCVCLETATSHLYLFSKSYKVDLLFTSPV